MKIIITENQLNDNIIKFLDDYYDVSEIENINLQDEDANDEENLLFYTGPLGAYHTIGSYFVEGLFVQNESDYPIFILNTTTKNIFDGMFGDLWETPFKIWFKNNFGLNIKTVY
jgi:hypothetical protein